MSISKTIGLLVGDETDWPSTLEALMRRMGPEVKYKGETYDVNIRRMRINPFSLRQPSRTDVIIDRLAYWHYAPREWLKKVALINKTYILNNPFTFQAMEKHSAYCAAIRLGLNIPDTWLIPQKKAPEGYQEKYERTAERYHNLFDLGKIGEEIGYPLFMKPFDGGGWREVTQIHDKEGLYKAYDASGQSLMHLQAGVADYDVFCRSLAIGPQVINLKFRPDLPQHARYEISHDFLNEAEGREVRITNKLINAFFRWDFNSCETIHKDGQIYPIDFANACPDIAVHSLHYYYPWAIKALLSWSIFCAVSERPMKISLDPQPYFDIADSDRSFQEKLTAYEVLVDEHFQRGEFEAFRANELGHMDEAMIELVQSAEFEEILSTTMAEVFPPGEQQAFFNHYRGLLSHWVETQLPPTEEETAAEAASAPAPAASVKAAGKGKKSGAKKAPKDRKA
ncbi:MAG: hypothetical protein JKY65_25230 [Planctomycetes bacterium]|nr:hypothetical protein [Planctomycetota bacterium]